MTLDVDLAQLFLARLEVHAHVNQGGIHALKVLDAADFARSQVVADRVSRADAVRRPVCL
ncbi:hypothetical protein D3C71_2218310 [compost metagenome]